MANRVLARAHDGERNEDGVFEGMHDELVIERSAAGQPGLMFVMNRYDNGNQFDQMVVTVPDGLELLQPVNAWLHEVSERRTFRRRDVSVTEETYPMTLMHSEVRWEAVLNGSVSSGENVYICRSGTTIQRALDSLLAAAAEQGLVPE